MKPKPVEPISWEMLASRIDVDTTPLAGEAPYGFATRVVAQWRAAQRDEALRRWSFWSLRAAVCSAALCGLALLFIERESPASSLLLSPPSAEFLAPPLTSH